jgi:hypothetical protein
VLSERAELSLTTLVFAMTSFDFISPAERAMRPVLVAFGFSCAAGSGLAIDEAMTSLPFSTGLAASNLKRAT